MKEKQEQKQERVTIAKMVFVNRELSEELSNVHISPDRKNAASVLLEAYNTITLFGGEDLKIKYRPEHLFLLVEKGDSIKCLWAEEGFIDTMVEMCGSLSEMEETEETEEQE